MSDWKALALYEARRQGVDDNIVLATIEAETDGANELGDNGNALGYGQVWPLWNMDCLVYAAKVYKIDIPTNYPDCLPALQQISLQNDAFSMCFSVRCIGQVWQSSGKNWDKFTYAYVGAGIQDWDFNRRKKIWYKYNNSGVDYSNYATDYTPPSMGPMGALGVYSNSPEFNIPATNFEVVSGSQKTGNVLFGRRYRVLVANKGENALDVSDLYCTFSVSKTMTTQPNYSEITIYNLNADTENAIIREGYRIVIEAGYEGDMYGVIFDGDVICPTREKEGTDFKLTLTALDGDRFLNTNFSAYSIMKGQNHRTLVDSLNTASFAGIQLGSISAGLAGQELPRGRVYMGMTRDFLSQIAASNLATMYVDDGKVNIVKASDLPTGEVIELSPESGLIGVPEQTEYGVNIKCLLNPYIKLNSFVHVDNSLIRNLQVRIDSMQRGLDQDGLYRVIKLTHVGDTRGNDWYTEIETITQAGLLPGIISNGAQNPW